MSESPQVADIVPGAATMLATETGAWSPIADNERVFERFVELARARAAAGRYKSSIEWCRVASSFATTNPIGHLRSESLEKVIDLVAGQALPVLPQARHREGPRRVLHVLSESAPIGGLSRLAERWIRLDSASVSSVALSRQSSISVTLGAAAIESGGAVHALSSEGDPIERATRLRALGCQADLVVCHLQPDDPVVAAAFGCGYQGGPVAFFNHPDHIFWLAPTRADLIVDFRAAGRVLTRRARGYAAENTYTLPLAVPDAVVGESRDELRQGLAVASNQVLAVSVARAVKFQDTDLRPHFSDLVAAALEAAPQLAYCAVGPSESDPPWDSLQHRFPGRVHATGPVANPQPYLDAADIYIDTFPFSSLTSMLEASATSLPIVTFDGHHGLRRTLGIADLVPGAENRPSSLPSFSDRVGVLAHDDDLRQSSGAAARRTYEAYSPVSGWVIKLEGLYEALHRVRETSPAVGRTSPPRPDDVLLDYNLAILAVEARVPLQWRLGASLRLLDRRDRLAWGTRYQLARLLRKLRLVVASERMLLPWSRRSLPREART